VAQPSTRSGPTRSRSRPRDAPGHARGRSLQTCVCRGGARPGFAGGVKSKRGRCVTHEVSGVRAGWSRNSNAMGGRQPPRGRQTIEASPAK
jgi:hypothetical protein